MSLLNSLINLFNLKIISILIKNNCIIYGNVVRNSLVFNNTSDLGVIRAIAPLVYRTIIERDLYGIIKKRIVIDTRDYKKEIYNYNCIFNGKKIILEICFVSEINIEKLTRSKLHDHVLIDIDLLSINRKGLSLLHIPQRDLEVPNPMLDILNNIKNKVFNIIGNIDYEYELDTVLDFIQSGWKNKCCQAKLKNGNAYLGHKCTICMDKFISNDIIVELPCKHYFHRKCWTTNLQQLVKNIQEIKCPMCRHVYDIASVVC